MSRFLVTLAVVLLFCLFVVAACAETSLYGLWEAPGPATNATPSYLGTTGLIYTPTAMTIKPLQGVAFYHDVNYDIRDQVFWGAAVGLPGDVEIAGVVVQNAPPLPSEPGVFRDETIFNVKYQVPLRRLMDNPLAPRLAVGVIDASNQVDRVWYLALSHSLPVQGNPDTPLNLHLGVGNANHGGRLDGLFGGVDFAPFRDALVQVEADGVNLNAALRYFPAKWAALDVGTVADHFAWGATIRTDF